MKKENVLDGFIVSVGSKIPINTNNTTTGENNGCITIIIKVLEKNSEKYKIISCNNCSAINFSKRLAIINLAINKNKKVRIKYFDQYPCIMDPIKSLSIPYFNISE